MRVLFDTHTFIWWADEPERLSETARLACQEPANVLLLSVVSLWEMQIKVQLGKLTLTTPLSEIIASQRNANRVQILATTPEHVLALDTLPLHHKDLFDRLLIAQANVEQAHLAGVDSQLASYPVRLIW